MSTHDLIRQAAIGVPDRSNYLKEVFRLPFLNAFSDQNYPK